jgi:hypothetical protein
VLLVVTCFGAAAASAAGPDDARATAMAFFDALIADDGDRACAMLTPAAVERIGGMERCRRTFGPSESEQDFKAVETLSRAYGAARRVAANHHNRFLTKKFTKRDLARAIERLDPQLTVKLGRSPQAAAGQLVTTVILDTRSTARRLVLYAESDDGSILRLNAPIAGDPTLDEVGFGIPETTTEPPPPTVTVAIDSITTRGDGKVLVDATWTVTDESETETYHVLLSLVPNGSGYLVDDLFYSALDEP